MTGTSYSKAGGTRRRPGSPWAPAAGSHLRGLRAHRLSPRCRHRGSGHRDASSWARGPRRGERDPFQGPPLGSGSCRSRVPAVASGPASPRSLGAARTCAGHRVFPRVPPTWQMIKINRTRCTRRGRGPGPGWGSACCAPPLRGPLGWWGGSAGSRGSVVPPALQLRLASPCRVPPQTPLRWAGRGGAPPLPAQPRPASRARAPGLSVTAAASAHMVEHLLPAKRCHRVCL